MSHSTNPVARLDHSRVAPEGMQALLGMERYLAKSLPRGLIHLVKLRASQINGCAYCIDMHWHEARASGESEQRLYGLLTWEEAGAYTPAERAALAWTEAVTDISRTHAPDAVYAALGAHYSEREIVDLTWLIATINAWNRIAIGLRSQPPAR